MITFRTSLLLSALLGLLLALPACGDSQPEAVSEKSLQEIRQEGPIKNSDIIRNPSSADQPLDTVNVAKMTFEQSKFEFGEAKEGDVIEHVFTFTNTGKAPLIIQGARSTCGCTVPEWPSEPIAPGESGEISVRFNTENKTGRQEKPVTVTANTYPATTRVYLRGFVEKAQN